MQERFVNTSAGNLTFLLRDLVAVGAMPIVAGRVYDSGLGEGADFGPGWKLALREEIVRQGDRLAFTDASNAVWQLEIDGGTVKPAHPASTPVRSGEFAGNAVVLRSPGLVRRFEPIDGTFRLVEASHATGSVRLGYRNGLIERAVSATATVTFKRRADGRIVAVEDALGRTATYAYDGAGRLASHRDLAGAAWRYGYAAGGLASIEDPRGKQVLHATYDGSGRVSWIEVQGGKSAFTYRDKSTRAVDGLNRTTVFHRAASGLTEAVDSPAGNFSQLSFDASGRPVAVARDGVNVAALGYDAEGRLRSLRGAAGETYLAHGPHGLTGAAGAQSASYGYDAGGRVSVAADADGARSYAYDAAGFPNRIELGQWKTTLRHDAQGQTTELSRDGRTLVRYAYRPDGRVASIAFGDKGGAAAFVYDRRGLRERAAYGSDVASAMRYDAAGNLVSFSVESPQGKRSQEYELGGYNEVARIRNGGDAPGPDVTFRYDPAGNAVGIQAGGRSSTASYDALDRVTRVTLDGETVVDYAYGPLDRDAVAAADRRTGETLAPFGLSPVFGTMDSVLYARPRPATHAAVAYVPALKTFEAGWRHLAPDALRLASLRQRDLPVRGDALDPAPFGHDKPSNSLFLPPEFRAVNCRVCSSSVRRVRVTAAGRVAGRTTTVSVGIDGTCVYGYPEDGPSGGVGGVLRDTWGHTLSFGDGTPAAAFTSPSNSASRGHVYRRAGTYQVRDDVDCRACNSLLVLASGSTTVTIERPCNPGRAPSYLAGIPTVAVENAVIAGGWGAYGTAVSATGLRCAEICPNRVYRILGNVVEDAWATATTRIEALADCTAAWRTDANVARTVAHEYHHVSNLVALANDLQVRIDFSSMAACQSRLMAIGSAIRTTYRAAERDQHCHRDPHFRTTTIYARYCPAPRNPSNPESRATQEVATSNTHYGQCSGT